MTPENAGRVVQVIGPVVDVEFPVGHLPTILNAVRIVDEEKLSTIPIDIMTEVAQHIGENRVRCISMKPADGLVRGMKAIDLGAPISIPVGPLSWLQWRCHQLMRRPVSYLLLMWGNGEHRRARQTQDMENFP